MEQVTFITFIRRPELDESDYLMVRDNPPAAYQGRRDVLIKTINLTAREIDDLIAQRKPTINGWRCVFPRVEALIN